MLICTLRFSRTKPTGGISGRAGYRLLAAYARGANGSVHVFQNANSGVRLSSVWRMTEYPTLNMSKVNIIFHNISYTMITKENLRIYKNISDRDKFLG